MMMNKKYGIVLPLILCVFLSFVLGIICFKTSNTVISVIILLFVSVIAVVVSVFVIKHEKSFSQQKILTSQRKYDEALATVAHELRSPIASVKGYLCAMNDNVVPPESQSEYINIALGEATRAVNMLESLMSLSRFDLGNIKPNMISFDINELIRLTIIEKINDIEAKNITVETSFANEKQFVYADKGLIKQVLVNLTDNAIKYNNSNGKIAFFTTPENGIVTIKVEDDGIGIDESILPHIWQRFYQADAKAASAYKGHGLGLCVVKEIINAHGKQINVGSAPGKGTVFSFALDAFEE